MSRYPNSAPLNVGQQYVQTHPGVTAFESRVAHFRAVPVANAEVLGSTVQTLAMQEFFVDDFTNQPDVPRSLSVSANAKAVGANVLIEGRDIAGNKIIETLTLALGANLTDKAFASIARIAVGAHVPAYGTISIADILPDTVQTVEEQVITAFDGQPAAPGTLTVVADANAAGATVKIEGTDADDAPLSETLTLVQGNNTTTGEYKVIAKITLSATTPDPGTVSVSTAGHIGLPATLRHNTVIAAFFNNANVIGETGHAVAVDASDISKNTIIPSAAGASAYDGKKPLDVYFLVPTE